MYVGYPYRYAPNGEVHGSGLRALVHHLRNSATLPVIKAHGFDQIDPEEWYPVDSVIEVFVAWNNAPGGMENLISIGMSIIDLAEHPPEVAKAPLMDQLKMVDAMHKATHRGDVGGWHIEQLSPTCVRYTTDAIWPDDLLYGFLYALARKALDRHFVLEYDPENPNRDFGGENTVMLLHWE